MGKKIRLIRTMVVEYEPIAEYYPGGLTIEEMAKFDSQVDDRETLFSDLIEDKISWEIIDDEQ